MLNELDYDILGLSEDAPFNQVISSVIIRANNGDVAMGPILDKIEEDIPTYSRHKAYEAVAKSYYKHIPQDPKYIELTREICLCDIKLITQELIQEDNYSSLDILAVTSYNYDPKEKALDTIELIIDSGFSTEAYLKLRERIKHDE